MRVKLSVKILIVFIIFSIITLQFSNYKVLADVNACGQLSYLINICGPLLEFFHGNAEVLSGEVDTPPDWGYDLFNSPRGRYVKEVLYEDCRSKTIPELENVIWIPDAEYFSGDELNDFVYDYYFERIQAIGEIKANAKRIMDDSPYKEEFNSENYDQETRDMVVIIINCCDAVEKKWKEEIQSYGPENNSGSSSTGGSSTGGSSTGGSSSGGSSSGGSSSGGSSSSSGGSTNQEATTAPRLFNEIRNWLITLTRRGGVNVSDQTAEIGWNLFSVTLQSLTPPIEEVPLAPPTLANQMSPPHGFHAGYHTEIRTDGIEILKNKFRNSFLHTLEHEEKDQYRIQANTYLFQLNRQETNGYANFDEEKNILMKQLNALNAVLGEMEENGELIDERVTTETAIAEEEMRQDTSISGTVIMGSLEPDLDGDNTDPRENPESYRPEGFSEDGERLKEIGQLIIGILRVVGVLVAVVTLLALGIRYMAGGASERAEYKKSMIPFLIGAFVLLIGTQIIGILYDLMANVN